MIFNKKIRLYFVLGLVIVAINQLIELLILKFSFFGEINENFLFGRIGGQWFLVLEIFLLFSVLFFTIGKLKRFYFPLVLIASGGASNIIDRFVRGGVVDYLKIPYLPLHFNFSDIVIVLGVVLYAYQVFRNK